MDQKLGSRCTHLFSAHAKESRAGRKLAKRLNKLRAVGIARGLAGGEKEIHQGDYDIPVNPDLERVEQPLPMPSPKTSAAREMRRIRTPRPLILFSVRQLNVVPSPSSRVVVTPFDGALFPCFKPLFVLQPEDSPLRYFSRDPAEIPLTLVLENRSEKAITGLSYRWRKLDASGKIHNHTASSDSYFVDVFRPVAAPGSRHLIGPSGNTDEAMLDHAQAGGGFIGVKTGVTMRPLPEIVEVTFEIDLIVFEDGEIAGPDPDRFGALLQCRKRAAEFVARQVRLADAEGRDAMPVISALADIPHLGRPGHGPYDPMVHMTVTFAREYLRRVQHNIGELNMREVELRRLENRPELPKFYRRQPD
jgi:hypothetical protein